MAKKMSIREMREAEEKRRKEQFRNREAVRKEQEEAERKAKEEAEVMDKVRNLIETNSVTKSKTRNGSRAKAAGLKSTFVIDGEKLLMTSFGKGNKAIIEKEICGDVINDKNDMLKVLRSDNAVDRFDIEGRIGGANAFDPVKCVKKNPKDNSGRVAKKPGEDQIYAKSLFEDRFFGTTFADNLHIQLIYNILDIKKILSVHANNIVYSLNNIGRNETIGKDYLGAGKWYRLSDSFEDQKLKNADDYEKFKQYINCDQLAYFGTAFFEEDKSVTVKKGEPVYKLKDEKTIYYMISLLAEIRHVCVHYTEFDNKNQSNIFTLDRSLNSDAKNVLDRIYADGVPGCRMFVENNSKSNFSILFKAFKTGDDAEKISRTVKDFYDFSIRKKYKNTGFSIRVLREMIVQFYDNASLGSKENDSIRSKLYSLLDFVIWNHYKYRSSESDELVGALRSKLNDADNKAVYYREANRLLGIPDFISKIASIASDTAAIVKSGKSRSGDKINFEIDKNDARIAVIKNAVKDVKLNDDVSYFSKLMYLITLFIDGKEINDLLTTMINKFDNIASLLHVMKKQFGEIRFVKEFDFFDSDKFITVDENDNYKCALVEELSDVNSFARMTKHEIIRRDAYKEAAQILGTDLDDEELNRFIDENYYDKKKLPKKVGNANKVETGYRNFLITNVLKSRKFIYLVRYANPRTIRGCIKNRDLIELTFRDIPDTQINRYYQACGKQDSAAREQKIAYLVDLVCDKNFGIKTSLDIAPGEHDDQRTAKTRTVISLYLNALYQIAKNLTYINSRYVMAFHALERDSVLFGYKGDDPDARLDLVKKFIQEKKLNAYAAGYIGVDVANADLWAINRFRNTVAHLNAVRLVDQYAKNVKKPGSYFQLYHFIVQHDIAEYYRSCESKGLICEKNGKLFNVFKNKNKELNAKLTTFVEKTENYSTYCMDFVKALCAPFGYNLARFKNLSIDELFDRNDNRRKDTEKKRIETGKKEHRFTDKIISEESCTEKKE